MASILSRPQCVMFHNVVHSAMIETLVTLPNILCWCLSWYLRSHPHNITSLAQLRFDRASVIIQLRLLMYGDTTTPTEWLGWVSRSLHHWTKWLSRKPNKLHFTNTISYGRRVPLNWNLLKIMYCMHHREMRIPWNRRKNRLNPGATLARYNTVTPTRQ